MRSITPSFHKAVSAKIAEVEANFAEEGLLKHNAGKRKEIHQELKSDREKLEALYEQYQEKLGELENILEDYHLLQHLTKMKLSRYRRLYYAVSK
jgi:hypothetical protein